MRWDECIHRFSGEQRDERVIHSVFCRTAMYCAIEAMKLLLTFLLTYLLRGATVLVKLCVRFRDNEFLQGGFVSRTPNPQPGGPGYLPS
jgi:hypothetical protein